MNKTKKENKKEIEKENKKEIEKENKKEIEKLTKLIKDCVYIKNCKSNKKRDKNSLSYMIDINLSQSDCVKLGIAVEKLLSDIIIKYSNYKNIKPKNKKNNKEKDHLFMDDDKKIIYYAELKSNLNLDTEKSKNTCSKCLDIVETLKKEYPLYNINWCLLGLRYINILEIEKKILNKYSIISNNVFGINEYLKLLSIDIEFDKVSYKEFLNTIVKYMFSEY